MQVGASKAEPFRTEFLRSLNRHGLRGIKLVISASWQRCRVHFMRNVLVHESSF